MNRKEKTKKKKAEEEEKEKGGGEEEEGTCRLSGGQNGTRTGFPPSTSFFLTVSFDQRHSFVFV